MQAAATTMPETGSWQNYPLPDDARHHTVVGTIQVLQGVKSPQLGNERDVFAYLPPSYHQGDRHYPVLYMHDGQNLFDQATSFGEEWHVDDIMEEASQHGMEAIVIGVANAGEQRLDEYSPFLDDEHGGGRGEDYLNFLIDTVKPAIDRDFRTRSDRAHTGIAGSSMGGLISLYGFFNRPEVFGFAGVMSPALWFANGAIFGYIESVSHVSGRIYLDIGNQEGQRTVRDTRRMRDLLFNKGYDSSHDLLYVEEQGAHHTESAWTQRLRAALPFLLEPALK